MNLRQVTLNAFRDLKESVVAKPLESTKKFKTAANNTLARLIIISADDELLTNDSLEPTNYKNFSSQIVEDYEDLTDRANGLKQAIGRVLEIKPHIIRYSDVRLEQLVVWISFLERYTEENEQLLQKAEKALGLNLKISFTSFNSAISQLKMLIKKHEELEALSMSAKNENVNVDPVSNDIEVNEGYPENVNVALVSNEYLHEMISLQTKKSVRPYINLDELDELFPNYAFIKGDLVTINAAYEDQEYETDISMSLFLTSIDKDFDTVVALITDFDEELDEYNTKLYDISPTKLVKTVQDIFNEKEISFFEVDNITDLLKLYSLK